MMSFRLFRSLSAFALVGALAPLSACTVYVLPEADSGSESGGSSGELDADTTPTTTDDLPTTTGEPTTGAADTGVPNDPTGAPVDGDCDFAGAIQPIFTASCGCHGGAQPAGSLSLAEGSAFAALVGVDSVGLPGTLRVQPGDPAASFLFQKLQPSPPKGAQMPIGGSLTAAQIDLISQWIAAGAPETDSFACSGGGPAPGVDVGEVELDVAGRIEVQVGEIVEVEATVYDPEGQPIDAPVTWTSSAELTLYADGKGALLGVSPGVVKLHASAGGVDSSAVEVVVIEHDPPAATFADVRGVTTPNCAISGCHVDGVEPGDLRFDREPDRLWEELLEDEAEQVDGLARVAPDAPAESYLVQKLVQRTPAVGVQMPIGGAPMDAEKVQVIVRWIVDGAPFN
jgi:hypothetical protein